MTIRTPARQLGPLVRLVLLRLVLLRLVLLRLVLLRLVLLRLVLLRLVLLRLVLLRLGLLCRWIAMLVGCRSGGDGSDPEGQRELLVFGAASLTEVFNEAAREFEQAHPHVDVKVSFAGSQSLRTQIENGAEPNVFASANDRHMHALVDKGLVEPPVVFAQNGLVIVVPKGNPAKIHRLADLTKAERLVLALETVPVGAYAESMLEKASTDPAYGEDFAARVASKVVSRENHVRHTLQKVVLGEADAAIVYATDAAAAGDEVEIIDIPGSFNVTADYPVAVVKGNDRPGLSQKFIASLGSDEGRAMLRRHGFRAPSN